MKLTPFVLGLTLLAGGVPAFADAHSDYTKMFNLQSLKTFEFKTQRRISNDPLADNGIWRENLRTEIRTDLTDHGLVETSSGHPDFYVAYYVGLRDRYDMRFVDYGVPFFHGGFRSGLWGWPRGYDAWSVPYTESTVIVDIIDAHTNQLVWRGYDTGTLNTSDPDRTLTKAVDQTLARFYHDARKTSDIHNAD